MEAPQMQLDNLQWEVNRLEAKSIILRAQELETSKQVDLQMQLVEAKTK